MKPKNLLAVPEKPKTLRYWDESLAPRAGFVASQLVAAAGTLDGAASRALAHRPIKVRDSSGTMIGLLRGLHVEGTGRDASIEFVIDETEP